jgi:hypothetical protein
MVMMMMMVVVVVVRSWKLNSSYNFLLGNPNDKIMYARTTKRSSSFPVSGRLERRHSLRLFSSSKRLSSSLTRCGSMRQISSKLLLGSDSSSSTEYPSTDCSSGSKLHEPFPIATHFRSISTTMWALSCPTLKSLTHWGRGI